METLIKTFHVDVRLILAQAVNFGIVFAAVYYVLLKPLIKTMHERTDKIEKGLENAQKADERLALSNEEYDRIVDTAKKEAAYFVQKAQEQGDEKRKQAIDKAKEEIGQLINAEREKMQAEKADTLREIKAEVAELVVMSVEKILNERMDGAKNKELIERVVSSNK